MVRERLLKGARHDKANGGAMVLFEIYSINILCQYMASRVYAEYSLCCIYYAICRFIYVHICVHE